MLLMRAPSHPSATPLAPPGGGVRCTVTPFSRHAASTVSRTLPCSTPSSAVYNSPSISAKTLLLAPSIKGPHIHSHHRMYVLPAVTRLFFKPFFTTGEQYVSTSVKSLTSREHARE